MVVHFHGSFATLHPITNRGREKTAMGKVKLKALDTAILMTSLLVLAALLTWIIPGGQFDREVVDGREMVVAESFHRVESQPQGPGDILLAPIKGFVDAAEIIGFVLIVGGAFFVLQRTGAVDASIRSLVKAQSRSEFVRLALIPLFMLLFSTGGAVFGMAEETIPFVLLFIPLAIRLGYDTMTGIAIPFVGSGAGFAGAFLNPFTIGIAQGIADVPLFSGLQYRFVVWLIVTTVATVYVYRHAMKVRARPELSPTFELDQKIRREHEEEEAHLGETLDTRHRLTLITFGLSMGLLVFGVLVWKWYIEEIAALFFGAGIVIGLVGGLRGNQISSAFFEGAKELVNTALIIALARGILILARDGRIIDTVLNALSSLIEGLHPIFASWAMFLTQTAINFFVPSGSGQAALTMPVMAPLSDLLGVSRQWAVLAFQFGDGFTNLIIPTSAVLMGILSVAKVDWAKWARWMFPLQVILVLVGFALLIPPYFIGWH
jgi:uncharacterized ion transporter superfamily protein YfcC